MNNRNTQKSTLRQLGEIAIFFIRFGWAIVFHYKAYVEYTNGNETNALLLFAAGLLLMKDSP